MATATTAQINQLYQKYFGRSAFDNELIEWAKYPIANLDQTLLSQYKLYSGLPAYDGSPIVSGNATAGGAQTTNQGGQWKPPSDQYQKISGPSQLVNYTDRVTEQGTKNIWGIPNQPSQAGSAPTGSGSQTNASNAFFRGDYALIKFKDDPDGAGPANTSTVWLVNKTDNTIRPFLSWGAFTNFFEDPAVAQASIKSIASSEIDEGGVLGNFRLLGDQYGVQQDGSMRKLDYNPATISLRYGQGINADSEFLAYETLDGLFDLVRKDANPMVGMAFLDQIKNDKEAVGFYLSAMAYGKYTPADVLRDIKRKELVSQGQTDLQNVTIIDSSMNRDQFANTQAYKTSSSNPSLVLPDFIGNLDSNTINYAIFDIPDEAYKTLVPILDVTSPEFKTEMEKVQSAFHDVLVQQLEAQTQQEKATADYNWQQLKEKISDYYGVQLSNNSLQAWRQLEEISSGYQNRGIHDSGLFDEAMDKKLMDTRRADDLIRKTQRTEEEEKTMQYYQSFASPEEISRLIQEDQAKGLPREQWRAYNWGLVPSNETASWFTPENIKKLYPNLTDDEVKDYIRSVLDENGNYRSQLYQNYQNTRYGNMMEGTTGIEGSKDVYQAEQLMNQRMTEEEKAYKDYTMPDSSFLRSTNTEAAKNEELNQFDTETQNAASSQLSQWKPPSDQYQKISGPSQLVNYTNTVKEPGTINIWGLPKSSTSGTTATQQAASNLSSGLSSTPKTTTPTTSFTDKISQFNSYYAPTIQSSGYLTDRNTSKEQEAIGYFGKVFGKTPSTSGDWALINNALYGRAKY
jgi:hypothetical protein